MSDTGELIVTFRAGVSEDAAKKQVEGAGATVRRRMRTDSPDEVMLLVRVPGGQMDAVESAMRASSDVASTERNQGGFSIS